MKFIIQVWYPRHEHRFLVMSDGYSNLKCSSSSIFTMSERQMSSRYCRCGGVVCNWRWWVLNSQRWLWWVDAVWQGVVVALWSRGLTTAGIDESGKCVFETPSSVICTNQSWTCFPLSLNSPSDPTPGTLILITQAYKTPHPLLPLARCGIAEVAPCHRRCIEGIGDGYDRRRRCWRCCGECSCFCCHCILRQCRQHLMHSSSILNDASWSCSWGRSILIKWVKALAHVKKEGRNTRWYDEK